MEARRRTALAALLTIATACGSKPSTGASASEVQPTKPAAAHGPFIDRLEQMSLTHAELAKGTPADRLVLAAMMESDGTVSGQLRPVLSGQFAFEAAADAATLSLRGPLEIAPSCVLTIQITDPSQTERAHTVDLRSGEQTDLGPRGKVLLSVARSPAGAPCLQARLQAARLWALLGENVNTPPAPARFEAAVLGARLVKGEIPAMFGAPGTGTWVLLKTTVPEELYFAFDAQTARGEFFPKTPNVPNVAARALFQAL